MHSFKPYLSEIEAPTRADVDALPGLTVLEFGTGWCGHCRAAQPAVTEALSPRPQWRHVKVEDGPDQALGRSFRAKLWPTLGYCVTDRKLRAWCAPRRPPMSRMR